jgi:hypothetical protein
MNTVINLQESDVTKTEEKLEQLSDYQLLKKD